MLTMKTWLTAESGPLAVPTVRLAGAWAVPDASSQLQQIAISALRSRPDDGGRTATGRFGGGGAGATLGDAGTRRARLFQHPH